MVQLTIPADVFSAVGLTLDIVGIVSLFWFAPEKYPDPQSTAFFALEDKDLRPRWRRNQSRRVIVVRISVAAIVVGFILQGIAVVFF